LHRAAGWKGGSEWNAVFDSSENKLLKETMAQRRNGSKKK
jgi:hypothetical protein